jgi:hypothetical protein
MSWLPGTASVWRENFSHIDVESSVPERLVTFKVRFDLYLTSTA